MHAPDAGPAAWLDAFFASYYHHRPVNATFIGQRGHDHRLPDLSEAAAGDALAEGANLLRRLPVLGGGDGREGDHRRKAPGAPRVDDSEGGRRRKDAGTTEVDEQQGGGARGAGPTPGEAETLDLRLARGFLKIQEWELRSRHFQRGNPSLYTGEAVFGVMSLFLNHGGDLRDRVEAATQRMEGVGGLLAQGRDNVRRAPQAWTERAIRECDGALVFFTEGVEALRAEHAVQDPAFRRAAEAAAAHFARHRAHLERELLPHPSDGYAAGPEALDLLLREGHFLEQPAGELVRYAEAQMAEAAAYAREHAGDFGAASPAEALAGLTELRPEPDAYYARYQQVWDEVRRIAEARALLTWPDFPIRYVPRPAWSRKAAPFLYFLFYRSPAAFHRPAVHDYLVAPLDPEAGPDATEAFLRAHNDSVIKLNHVVHHGGIGHHVQNWHAFRAASRIGRVAAVDCASRIAMFCGGTMAEGWACYATDLVAEAGALTPLERYAEVHGRVRMAARTVVDVRLHSGEMSLDEATDYYQAHAGMSPAAARGEAVKNSMFPGAAVMYLMGTDTIHELRREMARRQGERFELRAFHDAFLSYGSVPVTLVAEAMKRSAARDQ